MELTPSRSLWIFISWMCLFSPRVFAGWLHIGTQEERDQPAITSPRSRSSATQPGFDGFNPSAQIYCVGELPNTEVPRELYPRGTQYVGSRTLGYRQIYANLRELCARPVYGGSITAFSAGAYCAAGTTPPTVVFQNSPAREGYVISEAFQRIFLHCQNRCRCVTGDFDDLRVQGRPASQIQGNEAFDATIFDSNDLDTMMETVAQNRISDPIPDRARLSYSYPPPISPGKESIPVYFIREKYGRLLGLVNSIYGGPTAVDTIWIPPFLGYAAPICWGSITFDKRDLGVASEKCPASWFGGSKRGNGGFVCAPSDGLSGKLYLKFERAVAHPIYDELSPGVYNDYEVLLRGCHYFCKCPRPEKKAALEEKVASTSKLFKNIWSANNVKGQGGGADKNTPKSPDSQQYSPGYKSLKSGGYSLAGSPVNRKTCEFNTVEGFGLSYSLAKQKVCQRRLANLAFLNSGGG